MNSYSPSRSARESSKLRNPIRVADRDSRVDHERKRATAFAIECGRIAFRELTLDDFGGRSDALGG
jgi:hypothetical protein